MELFWEEWFAFFFTEQHYKDSTGKYSSTVVISQADPFGKFDLLYQNY